MIKGSKYKNIKRLKDALISNASLNNIDSFKENYACWISNDTKRPSTFGVADSNRDMLMDFAMRNLSKEVVEFLLKEGASCNYASCIYECKYEIIEDVYNYINEMIEKHGTFTKNTVHLHKGMIINRLIDPEKVLANKDRLVHTIDLIRRGFLSADEVREIANKLYTSDRSKGQFKMLSRELILTELGI